MWSNQDLVPQDVRFHLVSSSVASWEIPVWNGGFYSSDIKFIWLVVWNIFYFPFHIWDVILPIDELMFFKMVIAPPTSYRWFWWGWRSVQMGTITLIQTWHFLRGCSRNKNPHGFPMFFRWFSNIHRRFLEVSPLIPRFFTRSCAKKGALCQVDSPKDQMRCAVAGRRRKMVELFRWNMGVSINGGTSKWMIWKVVLKCMI
jgi:hypothetical protein